MRPIDGLKAAQDAAQEMTKKTLLNTHESHTVTHTCVHTNKNRHAQIHEIHTYTLIHKNACMHMDSGLLSDLASIEFAK